MDIIMDKINLFGLGLPSKSIKANAACITNMYLEEAKDWGMVAYQMPGLEPFINLGVSKIRGLFALDNILYVIHRNIFYQVNPDKTYSVIGTIDSTVGLCEFAWNGTQLIIATGASGYIYVPSTSSFTVISALGWNDSDSISFNSGYFISPKPNSMQFYVSDLYDGTSWGALNFASAEASPDNIERLVVVANQVIIFGSVSLEFWGITDNPSFPYAPTSVSVEIGLAAKASVARFNNSVAFLSRNLLGELSIYQIEGYTPKKLSNLDVETIINNMNITSDAVALSYNHEGHSFYIISFPTEEKTFCYDLVSGIWTFLKSPGLNKYMGYQSIQWNSHTYISHYNSGKLLKINELVVTEDSQPVVGEIVSNQITFNGKTGKINALQVECEGGVGNFTITNPQISLQVSRDGGYTYSAEQYRPLGALGEYRTTTRWSRLGSATGMRFKLKIMDAVKKAVIAAYIE